MKIKFEKLSEIINALNSVEITKDGKEIKDKLSYACTKLAAKLTSAQKSLQEKINDISIECCSVDKEGIIMADERGAYKFTKENLKKKNKLTKELLESGDFEIEPYLCKDLTRVNDLSYWVKETLNGVLFEVELEPALEIAE